MPSIFNRIDATMKDRLGEVGVANFVKGLPPAKVHAADGRVLSEVFRSPLGGPGVRIKGVFDTVLQLESGGFVVVDLKTIKASPNLAATYANQLHAYAFALENPEIPANRLFPVERLGLITFEPERFTTRDDGSAALVGTNTWVEIPKGFPSFFSFLNLVIEVLTCDEAPQSGRNCPVCQYLNRVTG